MDNENILVRTWFIDFELVVFQPSYASTLSELFIT